MLEWDGHGKARHFTGLLLTLPSATVSQLSRSVLLATFQFFLSFPNTAVFLIAFTPFHSILVLSLLTVLLAYLGVCVCSERSGEIGMVDA